MERKRWNCEGKREKDKQRKKEREREKEKKCGRGNVESGAPELNLFQECRFPF